uniref:Uncharacterized protein n=1 Tax=Cacopsylla melanoneura TaxID=428564 RepID=A0A8D9ECW8_9HEMI
MVISKVSLISCSLIKLACVGLVSRDSNGTTLVGLCRGPFVGLDEFLSLTGLGDFLCFVGLGDFLSLVGLWAGRTGLLFCSVTVISYFSLSKVDLPSPYLSGLFSFLTGLFKLLVFPSIVSVFLTSVFEEVFRILDFLSVVLCISCCSLVKLFSGLFGLLLSVLCCCFSFSIMLV